MNYIKLKKTQIQIGKTIIKKYADIQWGIGPGNIRELSPFIYDGKNFQKLRSKSYRKTKPQFLINYKIE